MSAVAVEQIQLIDLARLEIHPSNPRKHVGDLTELAASIKSVGLIEPIVAVQKNGKLQVVAGSRRLAAARKAQVASVPVRVMQMDEAEATAAALIENMQRKDLNALEQAEAFRSWIALTGKTQKELAEKVGLAPSTIANALRLLEAPKPVKSALAAGTIDAAHARELLKLADPGLAELALKAAKIRADQDGFGPGAPTVRIVQDAVDEVNEKYRRDQAASALPEKLAAKKAELEAKGATVVWDPKPAHGDQHDNARAFRVWRYLGAPTKKIASTYIAEWRGHDKDCGCHAIKLDVEAYGDRAGAITVEKVCTNGAAFKRWNDKRYGGNGTNAQRDATRRRLDPAKEDAKTVAHYKRMWAEYDAKIARNPELKKVLGRGTLTPNVLRLIAMTHIADDSPGLVAVVEKMTPAQLERFLVRSRIEADTFRDAYRPKISAVDAWMIRTWGLDARKLGYKADVVATCKYPLTTKSARLVARLRGLAAKAAPKKAKR